MALMVVGCRGESVREHRGDGRRRIVSLHDVTTEIVVALNATDRLVGITSPVYASRSVVRSVAAVQRVASLESILLAKPTSVVGLGVVQEQSPDLVTRLREEGIQVYLSDPATFDDVYSMTYAIAELLDAQESAENLVAQLRQRVEAASATPVRRKRVFVYDCCDPPFTAGGKTVLSRIIGRAGGENIFSDLDADWTHVSWEEVVARKPDIVLIHSYPHDGQSDVTGKRAMLGRIGTLGQLPSITLPLGASLGGLRSAETLEQLRAELEVLP